MVVLGLIGLVAVYIELLIGVAAGIAMLRDLVGVRRRRRARRPEHLADRMDRAYERRA